VYKGYKDYWETAHHAYSHWRSELPHWVEYGEKIVALIPDCASLTRVLDWGCGGGAISHALLDAGVAHVIGVDISAANLQEAWHQMADMTGHKAFTTKLIREPKDLLSDPAVCAVEIDAIVCVAVFQHMPNKEYARGVLSVMRSLLKKDGVALIQSRYDDGNPKFKCKTDEPYGPDNVITRCSWRIEEFWAELTGAGFKPTLIKLQESNYAWYLCR